MITLRDLAKTDPGIGSITSDECRIISLALYIISALCAGWFTRFFIPKDLRDKAFQLRMIGATLGRTPAEREPCFNEQIKRAIERDRGDKTRYQRG